MFASKDLFLTAPSGGYQISRSVRLRSSASAYLNRTTGTPTNKDVWTYSGWIKYSTGKYFPFLYALSGSFYEFFEIQNDNSFFWITRNSAGTVFKQYYTATGQRLFRDPSAWYHFVVCKTSALTLQFYVNGVEFTLSAQTLGSPSSSINTASTTHYLGFDGFNSVYADGYLTEINFIDGQALTPSSFGQVNSVTGVWQPIKYTGTYGTNGFYLNFSDNSNNTATTIGKDYSGNGNNWTPNNISVTAGTTYDSMLDVPTLYADGGNGRGNYAVINPIDVSASTVANGNLNITYATNSDTNRAATFGVSSGKWYWETTITAVGGTYSIVGITSGASTATPLGTSSYQYSYISSTGNKFNNSSSVAYGATYTTGDVIGIALDMDAGTLTFYKNNTSQGTAYTGLSGTFFPAFNARNASSNDANFGQRPFSYTPPSGFVALNTQNLPAPTISNGATVMAASTYTGTGATLSVSNAVNGVGFQPDFVWFKSRSGAYNHLEVDSVRGLDKYLYPNLTSAEGTFQVLDSVNSSGFVVNASIGTPANNNGSTYVAWQWQAGQGSTSSNTSGSITSTVSVNATAGFSVVTYTGTGANATVGHGLGVAPKFFIIKRRNLAADWAVYHTSIGNTGAVFLDLTNATSTSSLYWNNTSPTSSVFSLGIAGGVNNSSSDTYVAYCWSEVTGFSKFGSYTGNGSADGPFVYCGFRPRYVLLKNTSSGVTDWWIMDTSRDTYNLAINQLRADLANAELTSAYSHMDIVSNGFKLRASSNESNGSGNTIIFAAFAENPFKNSLAR